MHKNIFEMIEYATLHRCQTMIHTNATLLTEDMSNRLLNSSLTFLSFSFDGCTPEIYEQLRPPSKFTDVESNIKFFFKLQKKKKTKTPDTAVEIIDMKQTKKHIKEFVRRWQNNGCKKIHVQPFMTWINKIPNFRTKTQNNFCYRPCLSPFNSSCILSDGTVVPCCMDVDGRLPLGNITEKPFEEIWFGGRYDHLRIQLLENTIQSGSICDGCYNTFSHTVKEFLKVALNNHFGDRLRILEDIKKNQKICENSWNFFDFKELP